MERIPEQRAEPPVTNTYYVKERRAIKSGALIDWILTVVLIIMMFFISVSYFVKFGGNLKVGLKKTATDTAWVAIAILCVKELAKHIFKRKGQRTEDYDKAEKYANKAIKALNENVENAKVQEYCDDVTDKTIERYRKHQLVTVGLTLEDFKNNYLGKGCFTLIKMIFKGEISFLQARQIWRCNHIKTKPYNPKFITSYNAEDDSELVPSQQNDAKKADLRYTIRNLVVSLGSAFGICFMFSDIFLDFSKEMLFLAIIKIILLIFSFAIYAFLGWNLSLIETARNKSRAEEAKACMKYAGVNQTIINNVDEADEDIDQKNQKRV